MSCGANERLVSLAQFNVLSIFLFPLFIGHSTGMIRSLVLKACILTNFALLAAAGDVEGRISWNDICPDYSQLGHSKVHLDDGRYSAGIRRDGSFSIPDVSEGSYILNVISHDLVFDPLRVDVPPSSQQGLPDVRPYVPGTPHNPPSTVTLPYPVVLSARQKAQFFVERQSFNALSMLQNPMMLMMGATGVLVLAMPYIMKNLDPEIAKEVSDRQARYANIQSSLASGDLRSSLAGIMAPDNVPEQPNVSNSARKTSTGSNSPARGKGGSRGRRR